jgi:drug/metabolite transporter (DMT)-like permease
MLDSKRKNYLIGFLFILISSISFSTKSVIVKLVYQYNVDAVTALFLRMGFALPFFLTVFFFKKEKIPLTKKQIFQIFMLGFLGYYLASILDFEGLLYISAGIERLILFIYPTIVLLISSFMLKKKISKIEWISLSITYLGILIVFSSNEVPKNINTYIGVGLIFICAIVYAIYLIGTGEIIPQVGAIRFTALAMIVACLVIFLHFFLTKEISTLYKLPATVYGYGFLMGIVNTVIPTFLLSLGIKKVGSGTAAIIGNISPVSTILLAWIFLDEKLAPEQWMGTFFVILGVFFVSQKKT